MAKRQSGTDAAKPATPAFEVQDVEQEPKWREGSSGPNPLADAYTASREAGGKTKQVPCATADDAKIAVNFIRRAASDAGGGVKVKTVDRTAEGYGVLVQFKATTRKSRKYTTAQVRAWAAEKGVKVPEKGRVPAAVVKQYREAHGI